MKKLTGVVGRRAGAVCLCGVLSIVCIGLGTRVSAESASVSDTSQTRRILSAAKQAGMTHCYVPGQGSINETLLSAHCDGNRTLIIDYPQLTIRESSEAIPLDDPSQRRLLGKLGDSTDSEWQSFLTPGHKLQHVMSLKEPDMYILLIPKKLSEEEALSYLTKVSKSLDLVNVFDKLSYPENQ